ncbi:MAG: AIR synthase related protein [Thermoanaerobaculia bacterium]
MGWAEHFVTRYSQARSGQSSFPSRPVRDLTTLGLGNGFTLVVAVDSDGGIGPRENDVIRVSDYLLGRFAMRVPLMEILCSGALPLAAFDMLTVPIEGGGDEIIRGIRDELEEAGLPADFPLSGSTEDNVPTTMTGVGTTVLGLVHEDDFRPGTSKAGDVVLCAGVPKSGPDDEIRLDDQEIVRQSQIQKLLEVEGVHDALPVGSRGVLQEAEEMARSAGLAFVALEGIAINLVKSAGPSTCALLSLASADAESVAGAVPVPMTTLGWLVGQ